MARGQVRTTHARVGSAQYTDGGGGDAHSQQTGGVCAQVMLQAASRPSNTVFKYLEKIDRRSWIEPSQRGTGALGAGPLPTGPIPAGFFCAAGCRVRPAR